MRLTVCLEGNTEGRVLASVDMEEILKQCKENLISKEAFEKMKSKSHRHGYRQGYSKAIDDFVETCEDYQLSMYGQGYLYIKDIKEIAKILKEQSK